MRENGNWKNCGICHKTPWRKLVFSGKSCIIAKRPKCSLFILCRLSLCVTRAFCIACLKSHVRIVQRLFVRVFSERRRGWVILWEVIGTLYIQGVSKNLTNNSLNKNIEKRREFFVGRSFCWSYLNIKMLFKANLNEVYSQIKNWKIGKNKRF